MKIILNLIALLLLAYLIYKVLDRKNNNEKKDLYDEIHARDMKIKQYEKTIKNKKENITEDVNTIETLRNEIERLNKELSTEKKDNKTKYDTLKIEYEIKNNLLIKEQKKTLDLQQQLKEKEYQRRANATRIGAKQRRINNLEKNIKSLEERHKQEIDMKERTINYYRNNRKSPTIEEIKAYENGDKEVLKRIKDGK